jgi:hypothetical protein
MLKMLSVIPVITLLTISQVKAEDDPVKILPYPVTCVENEYADVYIEEILKTYVIIQNIVGKPNDSVSSIQVYNMYDTKENHSNIMIYRENKDGTRVACTLFAGQARFTSNKK